MSLGLEPKFSFLCSVEMQSSWWTRLSIDPSVPLFPQHLPSPCWQLATQRWASCSSCSPGDVTQVPGPHYGPARPRSYNLNEPPMISFATTRAPRTRGSALPRARLINSLEISLPRQRRLQSLALLLPLAAAQTLAPDSIQMSQFASAAASLPILEPLFLPPEGQRPKQTASDGPCVCGSRLPNQRVMKRF